MNCARNQPLRKIQAGTGTTGQRNGIITSVAIRARG